MAHPVPQQPSPPLRRSLDSRGRPTTRREGLPGFVWRDIYMSLLTMRWPTLFALLVAAYVAANSLFAVAYLIAGDAITNARHGSFWDAFFFSVQTMATIGYGQMTPATRLGNALVTAEALTGMLGIAMATGLVFSKFARPKSRVMFSRRVVVAPRDGVLSLAFRAANERDSQIVEATMRVGILRDEVTAEGERVRRMHDLPLVRATSPVFALSWLVVHRITPESPLHGLDETSFASANIDIVASMVGLEAITGQTVHARWSWGAEDVHWNHKFVDLVHDEHDGSRVMRFQLFHEVEKLPAKKDSPGA